MKRDWEISELQEYWTLQTSAARLVKNGTGQNRLGFSLLFKSAR